MRVPPNPLSRAVDVAAQGPELARRVTALVPRAVQVLDTADRVLGRLEALVDRLEVCEEQVQSIVRRVAATEQKARAVVDDTAELQQRAHNAFDGYEPVLRDALHTASYASTRIGPDQVDALIGYLGFLPMVRALDEDVVPMMATMRTVAPDLTELLAVSRALNELMGSLPGLGRAKKRIDAQLADDTDEPSASAVG